MFRTRRLFAVGSILLFTLLARPAAAQNDSRLFGVWAGEAMSPLGPIQSQIILQPNGNYTRPLNVG